MTTETAAGPALHTYAIQRHTMRVGRPLTFSGGECVVDVISAASVSAYEVIVTVLVELPAKTVQPTLEAS